MTSVGSIYARRQQLVLAFVQPQLSCTASTPRPDVARLGYNDGEIAPTGCHGAEGAM